MIAIFGDFFQSSAQRRFTQKTNVLIKLLQKLFSSWSKERRYLRQNFRRKYIKRTKHRSPSPAMKPVHGTWSIVLCEHQLTHLITKEIFGWVEI
jgi:hypothetical protein